MSPTHPNASAFLVWSGFISTKRDLEFEPDDVLVVSQPDQLRALGNDLRTKLSVMLRDGPASTTQLAAALGLPKGRVGYHLKVLERSGLIRVVHTRPVRGVTEKFYGRVARLFVIQSSDSVPETPVAAALLRQGADELTSARSSSGPATAGIAHVALNADDAREFADRLDELLAEFRRRKADGGTLYGLVAALYPLERDDE